VGGPGQDALGGLSWSGGVFVIQVVNPMITHVENSIQQQSPWRVILNLALILANFLQEQVISNEPSLGLLNSV
jgi:hypothetical protein